MKKKVEKDIVVFTGHFGSGKTEMAINYAIESALSGKKTVLVDIDIVNPFFRSHDVKDILEKQGVEIIAPTCVGSTMDIPALPAAIQSVFNRKDTTVIFDVGGDEDGARALSRYKQYFDETSYTMYCVINTRRPFTRKVEEIIGLMKEIEAKSRLRIDYLVSNGNLANKTTLEVILEGIRICEEVESVTHTPIAYVGVPENIDGKLPATYKNRVVKIERFMERLMN
jgi:hypothetical protein